MKKSKRIIALLSAITMLGTLNVTTVPTVISAEESSVIDSGEFTDKLDFVPESYEEAMAFYNKYGQVHYYMGYICTVQQKWNTDNYKYNTRYGGTSEYETLFNQEYSLNSGGYTYEVTLYLVKTAGDLHINWFYINNANDADIDIATFSFEMSEDYMFKQTDPYAWLPDSMEEYEAFRQKYGTVSIHNGYVVYCNDIMGSAGFSLTTDQAGTGKLEPVLDYYVSEAVDIDVVGGAEHRVIAYKPTTAGKVTVTWTHGRNWEPDSEYATKEIHSYIIDEDLSVSENTDVIPEWIPLNYMDTMRFYNQHGKTYIKDGYICTIMRKVNLSYEDYKYISSDEGSTADYSSDIIYSATFDEPVMPKKPEQSDYENYTEYEKAYNEYEFKLYEMGISPSAWDYLEDFQHGFDVVVYKPDTAGTLNLNWSVVRSDNGKTIQQYDLSFDISEDGTITETDMFAWVPDCMAEYESFVSKNGKTAVYNNHVIYCDESIYGYYCGYSGDGSIETVLDDNANMLRVDDAYLVGGGTYHVKVYKPTKAGDVTLQSVKSYEYPFVQYYSIDENLNISDKKNIGDCNSDGKQLSIADTVSMQKWLTQKELYYGCYERYNSDFSPKNADMNNDGKVNVFDCIIMKRLMLEKLTADSDGKVSVEFSEEVLQRNTNAYNATNETDCAFILNSIDELQDKLSETEGFTLHESELSQIIENMSDDKAIILMYTRKGASDDWITVNEIVNNSGKLTIKISTLPDKYPVPDMVSKRVMLLVDKNAISDVTSITVSNTAMTLA